jgi:hypothetical protein
MFDQKWMLSIKRYDHKKNGVMIGGKLYVEKHTKTHNKFYQCFSKGCSGRVVDNIELNTVKLLIKHVCRDTENLIALWDLKEEIYDLSINTATEIYIKVSENKNLDVLLEYNKKAMFMQIYNLKMKNSDVANAFYAYDSCCKKLYFNLCCAKLFCYKKIYI